MQRPLRHLVPCAAVGALVFASGCASSTSNAKSPQIAGAGEQTSYAERYPEEMDTLTKQLQSDEQDARTAMDSWDKMPGEVSGAQKLDVKGMVGKADQAGKSAGYVSERRKMNDVKAFFVEEKDEINKKVAGSVEYAAQQKGCENKELGGAAVFGVREAVDKRIEHRLRDSNEAQVELEEHRQETDKATADKLEKRLDEIANTSYLVHVGVVDTRNALEERRGDTSKVKSTLDKAIERNRAAKGPEAQKRAAELEKKRAAIDTLDAQAKTSLEGVDERIKKLQSEYKEKLEALKDKLPKAK